MAIEVTTGRVASLKLIADGAVVNIRVETPTGINVPPVPSGPTNETLIIFVGVQPSAAEALFTTELSRALARGLRVILFHEDDSARITQVPIEAPFEGSLV